MPGEGPFNYNFLDFLFMLLGLIFFVADIVLDVFAVVEFYEEKAYISLGFLLVFLLGSSLLSQVYSWLWYSYDNYKNITRVEGCLSKSSIKTLHVFQMGIYFRYAALVDVAIRSFCWKKEGPEGMAAYLSHDLSMLRLIETFSESAPQLVLMLAVLLQRGQLEPVRLLKAVGSASAIACGVTMYHRSLRSFLPNKTQQNFCSSLVYFGWNLLTIAARIVGIALFASALPCYIITHFLCSWIILFFFAWRSKTDFMDTPSGEWLYRATVGLIWYFSWFNVAEGRTRFSSAMYHGWMLLDLGLLCGLWSWQIYIKKHSFVLEPNYALVIGSTVIAVYAIGLVLKGIYYKVYHPKLCVSQGSPVIYRSRDGEEEVDRSGESLVADISLVIMDRRMPSQPEMDKKWQNKRMRKQAENFYTRPASLGQT